MPRYFVKVTSGRVYPNVSVTAPWKALARIRLLLEGIGSRNARFETYQEGVNYGTPASGTVTFTSGSGAVGAIIDGQTITVTWATNDAASMAAFVAAVNADPTASTKVIAVNTTPAGQTTPGTCSLTAKTEPTDHVFGNMCTLALSGTGTTVSGAKLTGGVLPTVNAYQF